MDATQILPNTLRYGTPPTMPQARAYVYEEPSTESEYTVAQGTTIQINIPRLQRSYLTKNSTLRFRITAATISTNGSLCLDTPGGYSLIDTIEVYDYLGSTLLEKTSGVGQLAAFMMDTAPEGSPLNYSNEAELGTDAGTNCALWGQSFLRQCPPVSGRRFELLNAQSGEVNASIEVSLPLLSFLGLFSTKLAPLHNGYTVLIKLNSQQEALGNIASNTALNATTTTITRLTVSRVFMNCDILELGPTAESMVLSSVGDGPVIVPSKAIRYYPFAKSGVIAPIGSKAPQTTYEFPLNINVSSMTSLWWFMRPQSSQEIFHSRSLSHRIRNNLVSWAFQYGSSTLPRSSGIQCASDYVPSASTAGRQDTYANPSHSMAYKELLKSRRIKKTEFIDQESWNVNGFDTQLKNSDPTPANQYPLYLAFEALTPYVNAAPADSDVALVFTVQPPGKFACGLSTDLLPHSDNAIVTGLNTNGMATSIVATFDPTPNFSGYDPSGDDANKVNYLNYVGTQSILPFVADAYVEYDAFISVLPNISTNVSF